MELNDKHKRQFLSLIEELIDKKIAKLQFVKSYSATVTNVVSATIADVQLAGTSSTITNLKNKTGETLIANDEVILFSPTNNFSNLFIAYKK